MSLEVTIGDLAASAMAVTSHGEDLAAAHATADGRVYAALAGWQGQSAAALAAKAAQWSRESTALLARLSFHAQGLHASAAGFWEDEQRSAQALEYE